MRIRRPIQTVKGYLSALRYLEKNIIVNCLKGFDKLSDAQQEALQMLDAELSNALGEFDDVNNGR